MEAPTKSKTFELPDAVAAQGLQESNLGKMGDPYDTKTRSCVTHVAEVLRAGGVDVPKEPGAQFKYLKKKRFVHKGRDDETWLLQQTRCPTIYYYIAKISHVN